MKDKIVKFRCTQSEKERIEGMAKRSGTTISEYCRQQSLTGRILAAPKLTPEEMAYFRELKIYNGSWARITNLIRNRDQQLVNAIAEFLAQSRELYNRFF